MNETLLIVGLALLGASVLLIVAEAFVPSGGIIGVIAGICAVAGVVTLFRYSVGWGVSGMLSVLVLGPSSFLFAVRLLPATPFGRRLIGMESEEPRAERAMAERDARDRRRALVGAKGVTLTACRPVGEAKIDGERHEVLAESGVIEAGQAVRVTVATMSQIKVRELT